MLKNTKSKLIITVILFFVLIGGTVGGTLAYLFDRTPSIDNKFDPVYVSCEVKGDFSLNLQKDIK